MSLDDLSLKDVKSGISIQDYFAKNSIVRKTYSDISPEQSKFNSQFKRKHDSEYYPGHYTVGMDDHFDGLDFDVNCEFFDIVLSKVKDSADILEVGCGSGLLGNYILLHNKNYKGIDSCVEAIQKSKSRAALNGNNSDSFFVQDVMNYDKKHNFIVGKNILNNEYGHLRMDLISHLMDLSDNLVFIQSSNFWRDDKSVLNYYQNTFKEKGFSVKLLSDIVGVKSSAFCEFVFSAHKK